MKLLKYHRKVAGEDPNGYPVEDEGDATVGTEDPSNPTDPDDPDKPVLYTAAIETTKVPEQIDEPYPQSKIADCIHANLPHRA